MKLHSQVVKLNLRLDYGASGGHQEMNIVLKLCFDHQNARRICLLGLLLKNCYFALHLLEVD